MSHLEILPGNRWAGHCTTGRSNKVWAACLAVEREESPAQPHMPLSDSTQVIFLCVWGPHGANLRKEEPRRLTLKSAQTLFQTKRLEKAGKGYASVDFAPFLPNFGSPLGLSLHLSSGSSVTPSVPQLEQATRAEVAPPWQYTAALIKAISYENMIARLSDTLPGVPSTTIVAEKVNGERCFVESDGVTLRAYNRKGRLMSAPPEGARALMRLGHPFVVDGERLVREQAGKFVIFDVLAWERETVLMRPYRLRMTRLVRGMQRAGLLKTDHFTPTLSQAEANSAVAGLSVLLGIRGEEQAQALIEEIQRAGGEGVVIRDLNALYAEAGRKYKFLADMDVFGLGIQEGLAGGSLILGVVRPTDRAIIEVGHVRSGFSDQDMAVVQRWLQEGQFPVFTVQYLPARTVGITLVEPRSGLAFRRTDKDPWDCSTDQFEPEKAGLIQQATPVMGRTLPEPGEQTVSRASTQAERENNALPL